MKLLYTLKCPPNQGRTADPIRLAFVLARVSMLSSNSVRIVEIFSNNYHHMCYHCSNYVLHTITNITISQHHSSSDSIQKCDHETF
jgi:hypothetical protein